MMKHILVVILSLVAVACSTSGAKEPGASLLSKDEQQALNEVFSAYEGVRALLVADKTEGLSLAAAAIRTAAQNAIPKVPTETAQLEGISRAAQDLASFTNLEDARRLFGELSRNIIALGASEAALQTGRYVFECSMVSGYRKWVQNNATISNPYMGSKMPACGTPSDWK